MENYQQIRRTACQSNQRLSKASLLAILEDNGTVVGEQQHFLARLDEDSWAIESFNSITGEVCVVITTPSGERHVTLKV